MKQCIFLLVSLLLGGCLSTPSDQSQTIVSIQLIDRHGFTETTSSKQRIQALQAIDYMSPQPYEKVLRVYGKNALGQSASKITSYHGNGQIYQYLEVVDGRANGVYRQWHPSGKLYVDAHVIEGVADLHELAQSSWLFDGLSLVFDEEGNKTAEISYEKGLLHGISSYYFPDGSLKKVIPYEKGLMQGTVQIWNSQHDLLEEIPYAYDEKEGMATVYWEKEKILSKELYHVGLLIEGHYYDRKGSCLAAIQEKRGKKAQFKEDYLYSLTEYREGAPEGKVEIFHPNQVLYRKYFLQGGKKAGEEWEYYPAQPDEPLRPLLCLNWEEDKIQGQVKTWYSNGQIESQREITNNKKQGLCFAWYKNGDLMLVEEYEFDRLVKGTYYKKGDKKAVSKVEQGEGVVTLYSAEGVFLNKVNYERGYPQVNESLLK